MSRRLRSQILSCHRCSLGDYSDSQEWHRVPWSGPKRADVVVVGEAPGKNEALTGSPFVGKAGKVLDLALESIGLTHDTVWLMNLICCRPPSNDFSKAEKAGAVEACRPWFNAQLDASGAWLVVLAGKRAYQSVMDEDVAVGSVRGKFQWFDGRLWIPTWHPAYVLRQGNTGKITDQFFSDWKGIGQVLSGGVNPPSPSLGETIPAQLELHFPGEDIRRRIERKGWVRIYSERLDDHMLIVDGKKGPKIPEAWKGEPRWTTEELMRIGYGGRLRISLQQFQRINLAKRALGAEIVA